MIVVDASALAAIIYEEAERDAVRRKLGSSQLAAPAILHFEMAQIGLTKARRSPEHARLLAAAYLRCLSLPLVIRAVDHAQTYSLAEQHGLTSYDASYLQLAIELAAPLITLDRQLAAVAARVLS